MKAPRATGLSLVEVLVVLVVLGIILAVAAPSFLDLVNRRRVQAVAAELSTNLAYARSETGLRPTNMVVQFGSNASMSCYTVAIESVIGGCNCTKDIGSACSGRFREVKTVQIPTNTGVELTADAQWPQKPNVLVFESPQMTASPSDVVITVKGYHNLALQVKLNRMGRISVCAPDDSMSGVARC